jgi:hypothetical protein
MIFDCEECGAKAMYNVVWEKKDGTWVHQQLCASCAALIGNSRPVREYKLLFRYRG